MTSDQHDRVIDNFFATSVKEPHITARALIETLFYEGDAGNVPNWRYLAEIVDNHGQPDPRPRPSRQCVVRFLQPRVGYVYLRPWYGKYAWATYPHDFGTPVVALMALVHAAPPEFLWRQHVDAQVTAAELREGVVTP
jgi:hypothetical protein